MAKWGRGGDTREPRGNQGLRGGRGDPCTQFDFRGAKRAPEMACSGCFLIPTHQEHMFDVLWGLGGFLGVLPASLGDRFACLLWSLWGPAGGPLMPGVPLWSGLFRFLCAPRWVPRVPFGVHGARGALWSRFGACFGALGGSWRCRRASLRSRVSVLEFPGVAHSACFRPLRRAKLVCGVVVAGWYLTEAALAPNRSACG